MVVCGDEIGHLDHCAVIMEEVNTPATRCGSGGTASNHLNNIKVDDAFRDAQVSAATIGCRAVVKVDAPQVNLDEITGVQEDGPTLLIRSTPLKCHTFENHVILGFVDVPDGATRRVAEASLEGEVGNENGSVASLEKEAKIRIDGGVSFESNEGDSAALSKSPIRRIGSGRQVMNFRTHKINNYWLITSECREKEPFKARGRCRRRKPSSVRVFGVDPEFLSACTALR